MKILLSKNADSLRAALAPYSLFAVVEAEYGNTEVEGSSDKLTLNHHIRPERPCPCSLSNARFEEERDSIEAVGLSHFDLDTLGGILALQGEKPKIHKFWALAEHVDLNGPHVIQEHPLYDEKTHCLLASFWAWSKANRLFAERDGSVSDVTEYVQEAKSVLGHILMGEKKDLQRGKDFLREEADLKNRSFVTAKNGVVLRQDTAFVNHLYYDRKGNPLGYVVGFNPQRKSVTVSRAGDEGISCSDFVQRLWGPGAGGRDGIAGSPRDEDKTLDDAREAYEALVKALS